MPAERPFSDELEAWLKSKQPKTLASLIAVVEDKSFAVVVLFLMLIPALPIPTAGITHIFEIIVMLLGLEMLFGRQAVWLPARFSRMKLDRLVKGKALPLILKRIRWFERHSSPRGRKLFALPLANRFIGLTLTVLAVFAFVAPPFSGLDTLPSLGAVVICLSLILDDALLLLVGLLIGIVGSVLVVALGAAAVEGVHHLI